MLFVQEIKQRIMETAKALQLHIEKDFSAPVDRLYQAWVNEKDLKQWWHPMGNILQHASTKPALNAAVQYAFVNENGEHSFTISGTYKAVQEGVRLVYTWNWQVPAATVGNSDYLLTVVFSEQPNGSRLSITQENFTDEEAVHPHRAGWEKALSDLHHFLSK